MPRARWVGMLRMRTLTVLGTLSFSLLGAAACRSTPGDAPASSTAVTTGASASVSHHREPIELIPVGLGGGPPEMVSATPTAAPAHTTAPQAGKKVPAPHPTTAPTWAIPPLPTAWPSPSTWGQLPSTAPSTTAGPGPGTPKPPSVSDAGKDF